MGTDASPIQIERLSGEDIQPYVADLAQLRIEIFRGFPYLYEGDLDYEERYLERYLESPQSVLVLATVDGEVVGASTGMPLLDADENFQQPFEEQGYDVSKIFYFSESVLRKKYRGHGIGVTFFDEREAHVHELKSYQWTCFAAVVRSPDHPDKPSGYELLHDFWRRRGYARHPEIRTTLSWKQVGSTEETPHVMEFWMKHLDG